MSIDFDDIDDADVGLFEEALEQAFAQGLPTQELYAALDNVLANVRRRYPGTPADVVAYGAGLALQRWERRHGCVPDHTSRRRLQ